ncbi:Flagellar motor switch protein fliN [Candidatus Magnetomorum sp. HK-1]|nr:Flagellar motor switch protein fliN [Candidatus Magnetomorum sp. HK-1]
MDIDETIEEQDVEEEEEEEEIEEEGFSGDDEWTRGLDFILDIPLEVVVELGRSKIVISELLQMSKGSIVELSKLAGEPMDIYVNGKLFARGEVVVVNEKFGVRLTDIVNPIDTMPDVAQ